MSHFLELLALGFRDVLERVDAPVRQRDLAELTATSHYTVNRVLSKWEARGILENQRARIVVISLGQLRRIVAGP